MKTTTVRSGSICLRPNLIAQAAGGDLQGGKDEGVGGDDPLELGSGSARKVRRSSAGATFTTRLSRIAMNNAKQEAPRTHHFALPSLTRPASPPPLAIRQISQSSLRSETATNPKPRVTTWRILPPDDLGSPDQTISLHLWRNTGEVSLRSRFSVITVAPIPCRNASYVPNSSFPLRNYRA